MCNWKIIAKLFFQLRTKKNQSQNFSPKKLRKFFLRGQVPRQKFISVHFKYHPSNRIPIWCRLFTSLWVLCLNFHETDQSAAVILSQKFSFAHVKQ